MHISGGHFERELLLLPRHGDDDAPPTVYGTGFNYAYGRIPHSSGRLTGVLQNGDPINVPFRVASNGAIV